MQHTEIAQPPLARDEVSVKSWFIKFGDLRRYIMSQWKIIAICVILGAMIGIAYSFFRKSVYKAVCTFVLEDNEKGSSGLGQYSGLASIVGIDVGSGSGLFQGDNIIELYKSRTMLERTLLTAADFKGKRQLLVDRFIQMNKFDEAWEKNSKLKNIRFDIPKANFTIVHDSLITMIADDLNKNYLSITKPDKKLTVISVQVKATDQLFAKAFTNAIVSNVNAFYIQTKTKGMVMNLALLKKQADSVRRVLNASIGGAAAAMDSYPNANPLMQQSLKAPSQRKQIDVQASGAIYAEVVKNLEIAKSSLQRETPLIQIIDEPVLPLPNDRIGKAKAGSTGMIIAFFLSIIFLIGRRSYNAIME